MENFDAIILATGYKSNVPAWLKVTLLLFSLRFLSYLSFLILEDTYVNIFAPS
jgi:lysine/ornithine N-monooxygenase